MLTITIKANVPAADAQGIKERIAMDKVTRSAIENKQLWDERVKLANRAAVECQRANYAESHPWRNLWAWFKREAARHE